MAMRGASGPLATTIFIVVSLAILLLAMFEARAGSGPWWYTAIMAFLVVVIIAVAAYLVRAVNGGTA